MANKVQKQLLLKLQVDQTHFSVLVKGYSYFVGVVCSKFCFFILSLKSVTAEVGWLVEEYISH